MLRYQIRRATSSWEARNTPRFASLRMSDPDVHWDTIVFCAKEAVFKARYPVDSHVAGFC